MDTVRVPLAQLDAQLPLDQSTRLVLIPFPDTPDVDETMVEIRTPEWVKWSETAPFNTCISLPSAIQWRHTPTLTEWELDVATVKKAIPETVSKVVLSRISQPDGYGGDPLQLVASLFEQEPNSYRIYLSLGSQNGVCCTSPERLFRIENGVLESEALAGTSGKGAGAALRESHKDQHEHEFVTKWIISELAQLGIQADADHQETVSLSQVTHLRTRISGTVGQFSLSRLISSLFPTPAVAGVPRSAAISMINQMEPARGYYSGLLGIVTPDWTEFIVLIRYLEWTPDGLSIRAGAGIVAESDPISEWNELNQKIKLIADLI